MSHGDKVVNIVAPSYALAGSLPEFSKADISALNHISQFTEAVRAFHLRAKLHSLSEPAYCVPGQGSGHFYLQAVSVISDDHTLQESASLVCRNVRSENLHRRR